MNLALRPIHYASISGGKDSLYMLGLILSKPERYPLDMVVNFELEIDWGVAKDVVAVMEQKCKQAGIRFVKIKPRRSWEELCDRWGFPNAKARWCNSDYKLDCKKQLEEWIRSQNCRPVAYIGLCADEKDRFRYTLGEWENQSLCYPLAEEGIEEWQVLEWARTQPIFQGYYDVLDRMGCMACPMASMKEWAYLLQTEPEQYEYFINKIKATEKMVADKGGRWAFKGMGAEAFDRRIKGKWIPKMCLDTQITIGELLNAE